MAKINFDGKQYKSVAALCKELGINADSVYARKNKTGEETLDIIRRHASRVAKKGKVPFRGVTYSTATEACAALGINQSSLAQVKKRIGGSTEESMEYILANTKPKKAFVYGGVTYKSLGEACRQHGIRPQIAYSKKARTGESSEEVFKYYMDKKQKDRGFLFKGKRYRNVSHACEALGVNLSGVAYRRRRYNLDTEEAIEHALQAKAEIEEVTFRGKRYEHVKQACDVLGINSGSVASRKRRCNISTEEALEHFYQLKLKRNETARSQA